MTAFDPDAYALAAWRMIEHAWRSTGTLANLAGGFRPEEFEAAPPLLVADNGRLDRISPASVARDGDVIRLTLPLNILDVWVDVDELAETLIAAIAEHAHA